MLAVGDGKLRLSFTRLRLAQRCCGGESPQPGQWFYKLQDIGAMGSKVVLSSR
jgi:hypothetical protein